MKLGKRWFLMKRTRRNDADDDAGGAFSAGRPANKVLGVEEDDDDRLPDKKKKALAMMEMDGCRQRRLRRPRPLVGLLCNRMTQQQESQGLGATESLSLLDSTDSTSWSDVAPWRVENILANYPLCESDWWEEDQSSSFESDDEDFSSDGLDRTCSETTTETQESSYSSSSIRPRRRRFRNVGLETFLLVNKAWKQVPPSRHNSTTEVTAETTSITSLRVNSKSVPSASARRDLVKGLASNRNYELKQRVSLHHLVAMYNELWTEDWSDE